MGELFYARAQMGMSLAFHIVFAAAGVSLPALMVLSDWLHRRTGSVEYAQLSKQLAKGTAVLFAIGAVSGTVLSFELGLLWPELMGRFGQAIGLAFSLEGVAFFTEALFLGIYLYGRERVSASLHFFSGLMVALSGAASAFFVTLVNAFMNNPAGIRLGTDGQLLEVHPLTALFSPSWPFQTAHVLLSCYQASAFAMVGIHAWALRRHPGSAFHRKALGMALPVACVCALLQPLLGDLSAKHLGRYQPVKLAALEGQFETERGAPARIGGFPDEQAAITRGALEIPKALSLLAFDDPNAEVLGLKAFPRSEWPSVARVHGAFQVMVGTGSAMALVAAFALWIRWRRREWALGPRWLAMWIACGPLGFVALESGWLVTEWGRQPWVVRGALRTSEALTTVEHLAAPFWMFTLIYFLLGATVVSVLSWQVRGTLPGVTDAHG